MIKIYPHPGFKYLKSCTILHLKCVILMFMLHLCIFMEIKNVLSESTFITSTFMYLYEN